VYIFCCYAIRCVYVIGIRRRPAARAADPICTGGAVAVLLPLNALDRGRDFEPARARARSHRRCVLPLNRFNPEP
jgi:hypothetical protein